ncbi:MAG: hypothetical protein M3Z66_20790 [Chloroflexota bacterium]|nr:hypothetical protein [Chloroflexota bacterium]
MRHPREGIVFALFSLFVGLFDLYAHDTIGFFFILVGGLTLAYELWAGRRRLRPVSIPRAGNDSTHQKPMGRA